MTREEVKEFLLSKCKILNTYSWSDDRKAYDVPKYVLSDSKTLKLIDQIYNYNEAQLKAKDEEIERLKSYIEKLWQIVDDIDTYGDMAKSDDALFRSLVEKKQKERWELPITTDGYKIILKEQQ